MKALADIDRLEKLYRAASQLTISIPPPTNLIDICNEVGCTIRINQFQMESLLGSGGFGQVFALDNPQYVIKVPNTNADRDMIRRELMLSRLTRHQNVIKVESCLSVGTINGIMMERGGRELFDVLSIEGVLDDERLQDYTVDLLQAITHIHKNGIFHLDIKPENILVSADPQNDVLKLCDFGLSHNARWNVGSRNFGSLNSPNRYFGSPAYVPHHSLAVHDEFVKSRDQWAAGCVIFIMAYGQMLYARIDSRQYRNLWHKIEHDTPQYFSTLISKMPRFVELILHRLLSSRPDSAQSILNYISGPSL